MSRYGYLHNVINTANKVCFSIFLLFSNLPGNEKYLGRGMLEMWDVGDMVCL